MRQTSAVRQVLGLAFATILCVSALLASASPALATCTPTRTNQARAGFAGTSASGSNYTGIKATIDEYNPAVDTNSEVSAWVMLNNGSSRWAQIGWMDDDVNNTETRYVFEQHVTDQGIRVTNFYPAHTVGTSTTYQQLYDPATKTFTMMDAGHVAFSTTNNWVPNSYQVFGETHARVDQMPGGTNAPAKFLDTYSRITPPGWFSLTSPAGTNYSDYGARRVSGIRYEIWDTGCTS